MSHLARVLEAFALAQGGTAVVWMPSARSGALDVVAAAGGEVTPPEPSLRPDDASVRERATVLGPQAAVYPIALRRACLRRLQHLLEAESARQGLGGPWWMAS